MRLLTQKTRLNVAQEIASPILFSVDAVLLRFVPEENSIARCDAKADHIESPTIHCVSWAKLYGVLVGDYDLMDAFMAQEIWTNGYLPLVFRLFAVFQPTLTMRIPE